MEAKSIAQKSRRRSLPKPSLPSRTFHALILVAVIALPAAGRLRAEPARGVTPLKPAGRVPRPPTWLGSHKAPRPRSSGPFPDAIGQALWRAAGPAPSAQASDILAAPDNGDSGAIQAVAAHPSNPDVLYLGGANGGLWKTTNATALRPVWTPLTDYQPSLSMGAIAFDPTDSTGQTLWAGIGKWSNFGRDGGALAGLLRSTNGGLTWDWIGQADLSQASILAVAARGAVLLAASDQGLYRSADAGASGFTLISGVSNGALPAGAVSDLIGDPVNPNRFYVAVTTNGVFRSDDAGATWQGLSAGLGPLDPSTANLRLALCPSATGSALYAAVVDHSSARTPVAGNPSPATGGLLRAVWRSTDAGQTWSALGTPDDGKGTAQDNNLSLAASPTNANLVFLGWYRAGEPAAIFRGDASQPATNRWTLMSRSGLSIPHADSRQIVFDAQGDLLETDDGGIYRLPAPSATPAGRWRSVNGNLQLAEFHDLAYDHNAKVLLAGVQDNGVELQSYGPQGPTFPGSRRWSEVGGGDGGAVVIDAASSSSYSIRYWSSQELGNFTRATYDNANNLLTNVLPALQVVGGPNSLQDGGQFITPLALNAVNPARLLIGAKAGLYESLDRGDTAQTVQLGFVANEQARMAYGGWSAGTANPDLIYVGTSNQVFVRRDGQSALAQTPSPFPGSAVAGVVLDPTEWHTAFVLDPAAVYVTTDAGQKWQDVTGNLTGVGTLRSLEFATVGAARYLLVGADLGVFISAVSDLGQSKWHKLGTNLPNAPVLSLVYDATDVVLAAGTLGRGAWLMNFNDLASPKSYPPFLAEVTPAAGATNVSLTPTISAAIENADSHVLVGSIRLSLNGTDMTATAVISANPHGATLTYQAPFSTLTTNTTYTVQLLYGTDTVPPTAYTNQWQFTTLPSLPVAPGALATARGSGQTPGFNVRSAQAGDPNWPATLSAGQLILAVPPNPPAQFAGTDTPLLINYNQPDQGNAGVFRASNGYPDRGLSAAGLIGSTSDNLAVEIIAYLDFPAAGQYWFGVNSTDGFQLTAGASTNDNPVVLGSFVGTRDDSSSPQSVFPLAVPQAGVYPFRLVWFHGTGAASLEWYAVSDEGGRVLINDASAPGALRAFRQRNTAVATGTPPRFSAMTWSGASGFQALLTSDPGSLVDVQVSTDLSTWTALTTLTNVTGTVPFTDGTAGLARRFYRASARKP